MPEPCVEDGYCRHFRLGGRLLAATWLDDDRMYLSDWEGRIRLLNVETGDVTTALEGLTLPRGLTVLDGRLYVSDMGNTCQLTQEMSGDADYDGCRRWPKGSEMEFFSRVSAQVLSFSIDDSGKLSDRQIVVDKIIAPDTEHAPNGLANDGEYVYVSIGHPQGVTDPQGYFVVHANELAAQQRRTDLMGAIARFRPPDGEVEVYATGFRNTYGISIAPDGTIYGADNDAQDGLATEGPLEELNAIAKGGFYGFPAWGTNEAPPEAMVTEPVAVLQGAASTFAHANEDGVYVAYLAIDAQESSFVVDRFDYQTWAPQRIFKALTHTTAILERAGLIYVVSIAGNIHVINPKAPLPIHARPPDYLYAHAAIAQDDRYLIHDGPPGYNVYLYENRLIYAKNPCSQADRENGFFVHVNPADSNNLSDERKPYGFDSIDFNFNSEKGWPSGDACLAVRLLPEYDLRSISTGQYVTEGTDDNQPRYKDTWRIDYKFPR